MLFFSDMTACTIPAHSPVTSAGVRFLLFDRLLPPEPFGHFPSPPEHVRVPRGLTSCFRFKSLLLLAFLTVVTAMMPPQTVSFPPKIRKLYFLQWVAINYSFGGSSFLKLALPLPEPTCDISSFSSYSNSTVCTML